ncbi:MAG: hypothetical protein ACRDJ5_06630 [Actinomycetota bacterium]
MSRAFFETLEDALVGFLPSDLRAFSARRGGRNLKVWYDDEREHYEAQLISPSAAGLRGSRDVLEVGFHLEHRGPARSQEVLEGLLEREREWRRELGREPRAGAFLGSGFDRWRRISEIWSGDGLVEEETAVDAADRLAVYIRVLEPLRTRTRR